MDNQKHQEIRTFWGFLAQQAGMMVSMIGKGVGAVSLIVFVGAALYFADGITSQTTPQSLAAQAATSQSTDSEAANKMCPPVTTTGTYRTEYDASKPPYPNKRVGACGTPAAVQAGAASVAVDDCIYQNLYKKGCFSLTSKLYTVGHCVTENKCHADKYMDEKGQFHDVKDPDTLPTQPTQVACTTPGCGLPGVVTQPAPAVPADSAVVPPAQTTLPAPSPANTQPTVPVSPSVPAAPAPGPTAIDQITAVGNNTVTPPPASQLPGVIQNGTVPSVPVSNPALTQPPVFANNTIPPPVTGPVGFNYQPAPAITSPTAQNTFYGSRSSYSGQTNAAQTPVTLLTNTISPSGVFNGILGFISGLLGASGSSASAPTVIQVNVTGSSAPQQPVPTSSYNTNPYTVVLLQAPPQSSSLSLSDLLAQDKLKDILSLAQPTVPASTKVDVAPVVSSSHSVTVGTAAPVLPDAYSLDASFAGTSTSEVASSTRLDLSWATPTAVTIGVPVDITIQSIIQAIIAGFSGAWTGSQVSPVQKKEALAQAQSDYEAMQAQISAWQDLQSAGLCDTTCLNALAALESQVWQQGARVDALKKSVEQGSATDQGVPVPGFGGFGVPYDTPTAAGGGGSGDTYAGGYGLGNGTVAYDTSVPSPTTQYPPQSGPAGSQGENLQGVIQQNDTVSSGGLLGLPQILSHIWDVLTGWFTLGTTTPSTTHCSLFRSLFGGCKSS